MSRDKEFFKQIDIAKTWFDRQGWIPFPFQLDAWSHYLKGRSGVVNAPTGSGKTYSLLIPILLQGLKHESYEGLQAIWITPIRALTKEIRDAGSEGTRWRGATEESSHLRARFGTGRSA